jgi:hypothetical protein
MKNKNMFIAGLVALLTLSPLGCSTTPRISLDRMRTFPGTDLKPINYWALPYRDLIAINNTNITEKYSWTIWPYKASKDDLKKYNLEDKNPKEYFEYFQDLIKKGKDYSWIYRDVYAYS